MGLQHPWPSAAVIVKQRWQKGEEWEEEEEEFWQESIELGMDERYS